VYRQRHDLARYIVKNRGGGMLRTALIHTGEESTGNAAGVDTTGINGNSIRFKWEIITDSK